MKCLAAILVCIMCPLLSLLRLYCFLSCADLTAHQAILGAEQETGLTFINSQYIRTRVCLVWFTLWLHYTPCFMNWWINFTCELSVQKSLAPVTKSSGRMKGSGFIKVLVSINFRVLQLYLVHGFPCLQSYCIFCTLQLEEESDDEFMLKQHVKICAVSCSGTGWERLCHLLLASGRD